MNALILAVSLFGLQDESAVQKQWPEVQKLWKDVGAFLDDAKRDAKKTRKDADFDDAFLDLAGRTQTLFKNAKDAESRVVKAIIKSRLLHGMALLAPQGSGMSGRIRVVVRGMGGDDEDEKVDVAKELTDLEKRYEKLGEDDEATTKAVESLQKVGAIPDSAEGWQLRTYGAILKSLAAGKEHPAKNWVKLTDEVREQVKKVVRELGGDDNSARDAAEKKLREMGDGIVPALKEELKAAEDPEIKSRLKRLLGTK